MEMRMISEVVKNAFYKKWKVANKAIMDALKV